MKVLIAKQNEWFFLEIIPELKFESATENTCRFECTEKVFEQIKGYIRNSNHNPYALMSW